MKLSHSVQNTLNLLEAFLKISYLIFGLKFILIKSYLQHRSATLVAAGYPNLALIISRLKLIPRDFKKFVHLINQSSDDPRMEYS